MNKDAGFSLVELLVVIAIITLLVALLMPIFMSVRDRARQVVCANNLQQLGTALHLYNNDYHGWFPYGTAILGTKDGWIYSTFVRYDSKQGSNVISGGATQEYIRRGVIWPYVDNNYQIYKCPGDKNKDKRGFSYSMNVAYARKNLSTAIGNLGNVVLLVEEQRPDDGAFYFGNSGSYYSRDCLSFDRHSATSNMLFGDNHVLALPFVSLDSKVELKDIGSFPGEDPRPHMR